MAFGMFFKTKDGIFFINRNYTGNSFLSNSLSYSPFKKFKDFFVNDR